jgi:hypothetical protein
MMRVRVVGCALAVMLVAGMTPATAQEHRAVGTSPVGDHPALADLPRDALQVAFGPDGITERTSPARFDEVFRSADRLRTPGALPAAAQQAMAQRWGAGTAGATEPTSEGELEVIAPGRRAWARPGGDLTGDGRGDVLVEAVEPQPSAGEYELRALRGSDGQRLWHTTMRHREELAWPAGDLTGDGADDLIVAARIPHSTEHHDDGPDCTSDCSYAWEQTFTWQLTVLEGRTGEALWTRTWEGWARYDESWSSSVAGSTHSWSYTDDNGSLLALPGGTDASGAATLALNVVSVRVAGSRESDAVAGLVGRNRTTYTLRADSTAEVLSAGTGRGTLVGRSMDAPTIALLEPAGDLTGDGAVELLWNRAQATDEDLRCSFVLSLDYCSGEQSTHAFELEALRARDLRTLWTSRWDALYDWWLHADIGDLDRSGAADILLVLGGREEVLVAASGATGEVLWERPISSTYDLPVPIGALDGELGTDLALLSISVEGNPVTGRRPVIEVDRLAGVSGETILTTRRDVSTDVGWLYVWAAPDTDGDAIVDIGGGWFRYTAPFEVGEAAGFVESGRTGDELLAFTGTDDRELLPFADLDGDGAVELLDVTWTYDEEEGWSVVAAARRLTPEGPDVLWTFDGAADDLPHAGGDQTGDGAQELLATGQVRSDDRWLWTVRSIDGSALTTRWEVTGE